MGNEQIRVVLLRQYARRGPDGRTEVRVAKEQALTLPVPADALRRGRAWRAALDAALDRADVRPAEVLAVNVLAAPAEADKRAHVAVTLAPLGTLDDLRRRRQAVTRAGRPIVPPRAQRTRATLQRGG